MKIVLATQHADAAFTPLALLYLKAYAVEYLQCDAAAIAILEFDSHFSMSPDDVRYGTRVVGALQAIGDSRTIRTLGREHGVTYADVIDAWLAWEDEHPDVETTAYRIKQFVVDFCDARRIPSAFYRGFASWELAG